MKILSQLIPNDIYSVKHIGIPLLIVLVFFIFQSDESTAYFFDYIESQF